MYCTTLTPPHIRGYYAMLRFEVNLTFLWNKWRIGNSPGLLLPPREGVAPRGYTAAWFPSSYLRISLPANMQEVVKMTRACVHVKPQQLPGPR